MSKDNEICYTLISYSITYKKFMTPEMLNIKKEKNTLMRKEYPLMKKFKPIGLMKLENKDVLKDLRDGLLNISAGFVIEVKWVKDLHEEIWPNILAVWEVKTDLLPWFDFIVCDDDIKNLETYLKSWLVPIINKNNHFCKTQ